MAKHKENTYRRYKKRKWKRNQSMSQKNQKQQQNHHHHHQENNRRNKETKNYKTVKNKLKNGHSKSSLSVIILNIKGLKTAIKRQSS